MPVTWVIEDFIALAVTAVTILFIVSREERPAQIVLELFCFVLLYAGAYETIGTTLPLYHYGRSLIMIGNVPLAIPLMEYLVVYATLRMLEKMNVATWCKPFIVGFFGLLQDFTLDPLAVRQVFTSGGVAIGRWTWVSAPGDARILGIPVFNFPGWVLILGWGSMMILLGRYWFRRSGWRPLVGWIYPVLTMLAALALLVSPVSQFLLWCAPFFRKGSAVEWVMLGMHCVVPAALLLFGWRGRMTRALTLRDDLPVFLVPGVFHVADLAFAVAGGFTVIIPLEIAVTAVHWAIVALAFFLGRRRAAPRARALRAAA